MTAALLADPADRAAAWPIDDIESWRMPAHPETIPVGALDETHFRLFGAETGQGKRLAFGCREDEKRPGRSARPPAPDRRRRRTDLRDRGRRSESRPSAGRLRQSGLPRRAGRAAAPTISEAAASARAPRRFASIMSAARLVRQPGRRANRRARLRGWGRPAEGPADRRISESTAERTTATTMGSGLAGQRRRRQEAFVLQLRDEPRDLRCAPVASAFDAAANCRPVCPATQRVPDVGARSIEAVEEAGFQIGDDHFVAEILENDFRTGS